MISIIGLLSTLGAVSLNNSRKKSRDAKRRADLTTLRTALELYADENNGRYPVNNTWWGEGNPCYGDHDYTGSNGWIPNLAPTYIGVLPGDPKPNSTAGHCYLYRSDGINYKVLVHGTVESGALPSADPMYDRRGGSCMSVYSFSAQAW